MQFEKFVEYGFLGLLSGMLGFAVTFLSRISKSITILNEQVGILLERSNWHGNELNNLGKRVTRLETQHERKGR